MALICLDVGHTGKTGGKPPAQAAATTVRPTLWEHRLARRMGCQISDSLEDAGHEVATLSHGTYAERQAWSVRKAAAAHVCLHFDAVPAERYALTMHDARSTAGAKLAQAVADEVANLYVPRVLSKVKVQPAQPGDWTEGAYHLMAGLYAGKPVGLVLELGQLGQPAHEVLWTPGGLEDLGRAVATGIRRWLG